MKRLSGAEIVRVWRARFAGSDAGTVIVSVEYSNLMAMAKADEKGRTDAEYNASMGRLSKLRKIVSDSLYEELKP